MSSVIFTNIFRFVGLVLIQVLFLQRLSLEFPAFPYLNIFVYPLFILLLPFKTPRSAQLLLAFLIGMTIDIFYNSPGVHASASVFSAFCRPFVLYQLEPRGGYNINYSPTRHRLGLTWFIRYSSILLLAHLFFYFSVEAFTFFYIVNILLKTFLGFIFSMVFILIITFIFNSKD